ncbi:hypothetical protein KC332_g8618 [Hortaea werneckii]|uniref:Vacuolar membrane protein n=1 Tax=Hortaea werneckii TaxID=91943 RepID=A0A3M7I8H1_HORWE|nr:hypothetical protein KC358_g12417 [Hortaea werneckii]KAI6811520.1 hypothetical protein KC350_g12196 [Hortaea werneckii]KAI6922401.1 hypothetical protein KC348_g9791 [Hortaea werneckii]KAI6931866.1 hypothetical protein KC341_g9339 [Hortaea werneckii]KAI6966222.1 hypothetical protein KC321_g9676 [Hortaea werneckii]
MASSPLRMRNLLLLSLALAPLATYAQETTAELPSLSASTSDAETTTAESTAETTDATTTAATTDATTTAQTTADDSATTDPATTDDASSQTTTTASFTTDPSSTTTESGLTDLPTLAGAGVPELFIPYTAPAPFMQKSNYPEGTVFIAVGAVLAFLGACVLVWRGMVAWSINRSVKKAAMASIRGASEKPSAFGGSTSGYQPVGGGGGKGGGGGGIYQDTAYGSSMSLDALTSAGKPLKAPGAHFRDSDRKRDSSVPPPGLFFSPTAQAAGGAGTGAGARESMRNSQMLPAGYYASPSAQAGGGAGSMTIGGDHRASTLAPYARQSSYNASPPESPSHNPYRHSGVPAGASGARASSNDRGRLRASRDGYGASSARNSYFDPANARHSSFLEPGAANTPGGAYMNSRHSGIYGQQQAGSRSSLAVGGGGRQSRHASRDDLGGSRAPSAYLEDLFDHSTGMQER